MSFGSIEHPQKPNKQLKYLVSRTRLASFGHSGLTSYPHIPFQKSSFEVEKFFSCSTQLSMEFDLVIKIKEKKKKKKKKKKLKLLFMLNSAEQAQLNWVEQAHLSWAWKKFQNFVSSLRFINKINFMLNWVWVSMGKSFITSGPGMGTIIRKD